MKSIQYSLPEIEQVAKQLLSSLPTRCVVLIEGEMGVGKTTLMSALLRKCGVQEVSSPTYSVVNEYVSDQGKRIHHYDLYRVKDVDELYEMGFMDLLEQADWHFIEWPALGTPFYPSSAIHWKIELLSNEDRSILITSE
jgi:tRNA threonylcarbamoyladenosine biosynthesis protein TsaE